MGQPRILIAIAAVAVVLSACTAAAVPSGSGQPSTGPSGGPSGGPLPSLDSAALILRATMEGGFVGPGAIRTRLPIVSVFADGRIITEGAVPAIYPGPLVPPLIVRSVGPAGAAGILAAARAAGLTGADATYGPGPVPDAPTTVVTVAHDGGRTVSRFGSLASDSGQPAASGPDAQVVAATADLLGRLAGTDAFGGTGQPDQTYLPLGYQLFVSPGAPAQADPQLSRPPVSWPLATPLASFGKADPLGGDGARVGVVVGTDGATLRLILTSASQITPFISGGQQWTIAVKPLLPDEVAALGG